MLRFLLALVLVGVLAAWLLGYFPTRAPVASPVGNGVTAPGPINPEVARQRGAELGEQTARAANRVVQSLDEAAITAKVKSKMALDDVVKARNIDVDTAAGGVVTLTGTVHSEAERQRAIALARDTDGVTSVIDRLAIRQ